jgi:hypothetical protein
LTRSKPPRVCGGLKGAAASVPTGQRKQEAQSRLRLLGRARQAETGIPALPTRVPHLSGCHISNPSTGFRVRTIAHPAEGCQIAWHMDGYGEGCRAGSQQLEPQSWILMLACPRLTILQGTMARLTMNPQTPAWPIDRSGPIRHLVG